MTLGGVTLSSSFFYFCVTSSSGWANLKSVDVSSAWEPSVCVYNLLTYCTHIHTQLVGMALLGIGIYLHVETAIDNLGLGGLLSNPAIILIIIGSVLFLLGFCGCFGALLELFILLVIVRTLHVPQETAVYFLPFHLCSMRLCCPLLFWRR